MHHKRLEPLPGLQQNWHPKALPIILLFAILLLTGCTNPEAMRAYEQFAIKNQASPATQEIDATNRLLVQGVDGNLYTIQPDGEARVPLTNDASSLHQYIQPTWSPTGNKIAWAEIDNRTGELKSALTVSQFDGLARERFELPYAPFYMQWSPDETRLAYLSNWLNLNQTTTTIALRMVDLAATTEDNPENNPENNKDKVSTLVEGQPLYMTWSPAGDRLLIHIDNDRLEFWDVAGEGAALAPTFAAFPAPEWSSDGAQLLYALGEPGSQQLVLTDLDGNQTQEITDFDTNISFSLSPSNDRVAYAVTEANMGLAAFGPLYVVELDGLRTRELTSQPVMAFYWSPDGSKLAYLVTDDSDNTLRLRWQVWDGKTTQKYAAIVPSQIFLQSYIAFFDQYARGMTPWSPDSTAFAYAAIDQNASSNIWVQHLDATQPELVSRGVFVAWSPR